MTSYGHYLLLCCRVFRDINETSTEEACLQLDILSFRTLHAKLQMSMGRLYYLIGGRQTTMCFFLLFPNLDMVFRNSTPGEFRMYLTR